MSEEIRIAVLSDSHGLLRRSVVAELEDCTHILHAGDIVKETDLDELRLYGNLYAVRGNNDYLSGVRDLRGILRFEIGGKTFVMVHDRRDVPRDLSGVDAVVFGHSHRWTEETENGRLWLNPGACGHSRFGGELSMARIILRDGEMTVQKIVIDDSKE